MRTRYQSAYLEMSDSLGGWWYALLDGELVADWVNQSDYHYSCRKGRCRQYRSRQCVSEIGFMDQHFVGARVVHHPYKRFIGPRDNPVLAELPITRKRIAEPPRSSSILTCTRIQYCPQDVVVP